MSSQNQQYQLFKPLSEDEYAALKADIAERGVLVPVELDENGAILDGHHRVRAWQELRAEGVDVPDYPRIIRVGLKSEAEKRNHIRALNLLRRQLSSEERARVLMEMRADGMTFSAIAEQVGMSVEGVRKALSQFSTELKTDASILGRDGKRYPMQRKKRAGAILAVNQKAQERAQKALAHLPELPELTEALGAVDASTVHALDRKRHTETAKSVLISGGYVQIADESETSTPDTLDAVTLLDGVRAAEREHRRIARAARTPQNAFQHVWFSVDVRSQQELLVLLALLNPYHPDQWGGLHIHPDLISQKTRIDVPTVIHILQNLEKRGIIRINPDQSADLISAPRGL